MRILVFGAGVLGSYLAHALVRGGNDVTILARGTRAEELQRDGLVIRHYFQRKTTIDKVKVTDTLPSDDIYDLIFVVMKFNDFPSVLPILAENQSRNIVLVGNNAEAGVMQTFLQEISAAEKKIVFGFQLSGGRREKGRILCIRGGGQMVLGGLDGSVPFRAILEKAFEKANYKLSFHNDMDTWLKSHIVPILALNSAVYFKNGRMKEIAKDKKLIKQMIAAMDEGFKVLESLGYTVTPANQATVIRKYKRLVYLFLIIYHRLPIAQKIDGSFEEIAALHKKFKEWRQTTPISVPRWDEMEEQFISKFNGRS
ncbi:ketopantoate reductase family protein [Paenibacillus paridis]|uniref:ketopantoate reductase family protein n=1 Tax=Paenibacillus paridis TaxID=2583376 RepID=UPI00111DDA01|nr:2-dehydropantoate 2-reductase N-terminal domain-containing protein [Paenibacillus paridis]